MTTRHIAWGLLLLAAAGCDKGATESPAKAAAPAGSTSATVVAKPAASASAAPPPAAPTAWAGSYDAKVGEVNPPKAAHEKTWTKDPGTAAIGKGTIELTVAPAKGVVTGTAAGPLGDLVVSGELDDKELRANLTPKEPNGEHAMTGVLSLTKNGDKLEGTLRASDRDAKIVREATVELAPK